MKPAQSPARALRVMIVDDNADSAELMALMLRERGHAAEIRHNAEALWMVPDLGAVDVFVLDIGLPGMDGVTLARSLRADPALANARLIAITGDGQTHFNTALQAGFDEYLNKPVHMDVLLDLLET